MPWSARTWSSQTVRSVVLELDVDPLETLVPLGLRVLGVDPAVRLGEVDGVGEGREQRPRVEVVGDDDVDLHADHRDRRGQVDQREQAEDEREHRVDRVGLRDHVIHVDPADALQHLPEHGHRQGSGEHLAERLALGGRQHHQHAEHGRGRHDRGHLQHPAQDDADVEPEGPGMAGQDRQQGQGKQRQAGDEQEEQAADPAHDRVQPAVARDGQRHAQGVLGGLAQPHRAVQGGERTDDDRRRASLEAAGLPELGADDRELVQCRVEHLSLQVLVALQDEAEHRGRDQEHREDRDERVVGDDRGQVVALVVEELVGHPEREPDDGVTTLEVVDAVHDGRHGATVRAGA